jgi:hypothetical protein
MNDTINRVPPPPPPRDPIRTAATNAANIVKREDNQPQKEDKPPKPQKDNEPLDTVDISGGVVPEIEELDNGTDQFWISVERASDLLQQHQHIYQPTEFQQLVAHLTYLKAQDIERLYWHPNMTFAQALTEAATPEPSPFDPDSEQ